MTTRPVPRTAGTTVMYAVMTGAPLETEHFVALPSAELLRRYGSSEASLARLSARPHQLLIMRSATVDDAAFALRDARTEALILAEQHDGLVIDLAIPRTVDQHSSTVSLAHATQWYVVDYAHLAQGQLHTVGLASFGLPELVVTDVDADQHAMVNAVLAGLVHRLIAEWPAHDPVGGATITLRDIAYGLGDPAAAETPKDRSIDVTIEHDPAAERLLVRLQGDPATAIFA